MVKKWVNNNAVPILVVVYVAFLVAFVLVFGEMPIIF